MQFHLRLTDFLLNVACFVLPFYMCNRVQSDEGSRKFLCDYIVVCVVFVVSADKYMSSNLA